MTVAGSHSNDNADPEKGHVRRSSDIERPASSHHTDDDDDDDDDDGSELGEKKGQGDKGDVPPASPSLHDNNANAIFPAATVGEPSGEGIYACEPNCDPCRTRTRSRASSVRSRPLTIVPRSRRRGLLARFAVVPEVERPYDYRNSTKWTITAAISLATAAAPMGSSIFYPALPTLSAELNTTQTVANMSVAVYMLSMAIFPLWWSSFSEHLGRRTIYLVSFALFVVFSVLCAVSTNMAMLVVFRTCAGGASASVQAVGAGTIADIWESFERGQAMSFFYLGPLLGPLLAPIFGGILAQELGWQSTMWFLAIYGLCCFILLVLLLPETLAVAVPAPRLPLPAAAAAAAASSSGDNQPAHDLERTASAVTTTAESARVNTKRFAALLRRLLIDPLSVLLILRFPAVTITVLVAAIAFGALFVANIAIQRGFSAEPYGYSQLIVGLMYIPPGIGYIVASFIGGKWIDNIMAREARKANRYDADGKLILLPEDRMRENAWIANTVYPLSLLMFGWTIQYGVHWTVPSIAMFAFGVSSMLVFAVATTMLTEFVRKKSSAGVAVNNFVRNILSSVGTVVAQPWLDAIDAGWVFTAICIFCLAAGFLGIFMLRKNAQKWRKAMDVALEKM